MSDYDNEINPGGDWGNNPPKREDEDTLWNEIQQRQRDVSIAFQKAAKVEIDDLKEQLSQKDIEIHELRTALILANAEILKTQEYANHLYLQKHPHLKE